MIFVKLKKKLFKNIISFHKMQLIQNNEIPTEYFLGCCTDIFSLIDNFGSSAFIPVKVDIYGNINVKTNINNTDLIRLLYKNKLFFAI
jgi:hypothetical protein